MSYSKYRQQRQLLRYRAGTEFIRRKPDHPTTIMFFFNCCYEMNLPVSPPDCDVEVES